MGKSGAGHFVKMVHNGIEYGMMQALGEGFEIMKKSPFSLDMLSVAKIYNHGSVIESRLVGWLIEAYAKFGNELNADECCSAKCRIAARGSGQSMPRASLAYRRKLLKERWNSAKNRKRILLMPGQVVSALRHQFGGHNASNKKK